MSWEGLSRLLWAPRGACITKPVMSERIVFGFV